MTSSGLMFPKPRTRKSLKAKRDRDEAKVLVCPWCKSAFSRPAYRIGSKYCRIQCYLAKVKADKLRALDALSCAKCGGKILRVKSTKGGKRFCSPECSRAFQVGANSHHWRGGAIEGRGAGWGRISESIRIRDGHCCRWCSKTQADNGVRLSIDHVRPWREFNSEEEANHPDNLVSLCRSCHAKKQKLENRWLRGDGLALQEYRRMVGISAKPTVEQPLAPGNTNRLGPPPKKPDYKARGQVISAAKKAYYAKPGVKEAWAVFNRTKAKSPDFRAKVSASMKARWAAPEFRDRTVAAIRAERAMRMSK